MIKAFLLALTIFTSVSGLTLPQVMQQSWVIIPTYSVANKVQLQLAKPMLLRPAPQRTSTNPGPVLQAKAAIVLDDVTGQVLWQKNPDAVVPIASITKLMTSLVAVDHITNWDDSYTMQGSDHVGGESFPASKGDQFTKHDLLKTTLIFSANNAAMALAHSTGLSDDEFVRAMNAKAQQLGLLDTHYVEPSGLKVGDVSTARDLALLMRTIEHEPILLEAASQANHQMTRQNPNQDHPVITLKTTDWLLRDHNPNVIAGKTGFTDEAGSCFVSLDTNQAGHHIIVVVLGSPDTSTRFSETQQLIDWTYQNYQW